MAEKNKQTSNPDKPTHYQIRIKGHLGTQWSDWFDGMSITLEQNDETLIHGPVADQAALHGLLSKVRDLSLPLISVISLNIKPSGEENDRQELSNIQNETNSLTKIGEKS
jgi:hypothetical protein